MSKLDKHSARQTPTIPLNVFRRASRLLWEELFLLGVASYIWMLLGCLHCAAAAVDRGTDVHGESGGAGQCHSALPCCSPARGAS